MSASGEQDSRLRPIMPPSSSKKTIVKGKRCVAFGCSKTHKDSVSLHHFPMKNSLLMRQWVAFVKRKRNSWPGPTQYSCLCSDHFTTDCYPMKYKIMESQGKPVARRNLLDDAVPTIDSPDTAACASSSKPARMAFTKRENARVSCCLLFIHLNEIFTLL